MNEADVTSLPPELMRRHRGKSAAVLLMAWRAPSVLIGCTIVGTVVSVALLAPVLAPRDPLAQIATPLMAPGARFPAGTDELGRDELSRLFFGARVSLIVSAISVGIALVLGGTPGILAGYYGGWVDNVVMRVMDLLFSMPALVLAIAIAAILGPGVINVAIAIGIVYAPTFARIARGPTLSVTRLPYIEAARALGARTPLIVLRHVLPNVSAPLLVQTTVSLSTAILTEASLSFLGLGSQPPTPSWGLMLSDARQYMLMDPWIAIFPGCAIALTVLGFNLLGDGLRDLFDPRLRVL
jgi:peptide/nickel transport system permease protein